MEGNFKHAALPAAVLRNMQLPVVRQSDQDKAEDSVCTRHALQMSHGVSGYTRKLGIYIQPDGLCC
jgi:hypothetical protein